MNVTRPPMGWNSWNTFAGNIDEKLIRESADALADNGFLQAGYSYLVIDDCWSKRQRDPQTGKIVPDPDKFPNGMKAVSDYVHSKGLKFGMYSCAGVRTCADYPGSYGHEFLDAETFAEYGCDFLKYDFCYKPSTADGELLYRRMGHALRACGRDILFSACNWGSDECWNWMRSTGAHMYRSTGDIFDNFASFRDIAMSQLPNLSCSGAECFNDVDMLTVGMYGKGHVGNGGCSDAEYRTEFALWCMFSAPLMIGCDIRSISPEAKALLTNPHLIRIDQDSQSRPPIIVTPQWGEKSRVMLKHLDDGSYALGVFNLNDGDCGVPVMLEDLGIPADTGYGLEITDVFTGEQETFFEYYNKQVPAHSCRVYLAHLVRK